MAKKHTKPTNTEPKGVVVIAQKGELPRRPNKGEAALDPLGAAEKPMSFAEAQAELAGLGYTLRRTGHGDELRAAPKDGTPASREERAIYTDDLADAVGTVQAEVDRYAHLQRDFPFPVGATGKPAQGEQGQTAADTQAIASPRLQPRSARPGAGI